MLGLSAAPTTYTSQSVIPRLIKYLRKMIFFYFLLVGSNMRLRGHHTWYNVYDAT